MVLFQFTILVGFKNGQNNDCIKKKSVIIDGTVKKFFSIAVSKLVGCVRVFYELFPKKCTYSIDVVCWGKVAKIYYPEGTCTYTPIIQKTNIWVPIHIEHHYSSSIPLDLLEAYCSSYVDIYFFNGFENLSPAAQNDTTRIFFSKDLIDFKEISLLYSFNPYEPEPESEVKTRNNSLTSDTFESTVISPEKQTQLKKCVTYLFKNFEKLYPKMKVLSTEYVNKLTEIYGEIDAQSDIFDPTQEDWKKFKMKIPGQIFLCKLDYMSFRISSSNLPIKVILILGNSVIFSKEQYEELRPIVIQVNKLDNFPIRECLELNISDIYLKYDILDIIKRTTEIYPLKNLEGKSVYVYDSQFFKTAHSCSRSFFEFKETRKFIIDVYGLRKVKRQNAPKMFGMDKNDIYLSNLNRCPSTNPTGNDNIEHLHLASCTFDLSPLSHNVWILKERGICQEPIKIYRNYEFDQNQCTPDLNINCINLCKRPEKVYLTESKFIELSSSLSLTIYFESPVSIIQERLEIDFCRMFLIIHSESCASSLISKVLKYNYNLIKNTGEEDEQNDTVNKEILTGFVLDNGTNFAIFLEGQSDGYIMILLNVISSFVLKTADIFVNTKFVFSKRLYGCFIKGKIPGLFIITLRESLRSILKKPLLFLKGNTPLPALQALRKFDQIYRSNNLQFLLQDNLFPEPIELMSMNMEFGVSHKWKHSSEEIDDQMKKSEIRNESMISNLLEMFKKVSISSNDQ